MANAAPGTPLLPPLCGIGYSHQQLGDTEKYDPPYNQTTVETNLSDSCATVIMYPLLVDHDTGIVIDITL